VAAKTFYVKATAVNGFGSLSETDPGASTTSTGWTPAKVAAARFSAMLYATTRASGTFTTTDYLVTTHPNPGSGDSWRSENTITGTFANTNWVFAAKFRSSTSNLQAGRVKVRVWKSVNADGSSGTELTSATQTGTTTGTIATGADSVSGKSPPLVARTPPTFYGALRPRRWSRRISRRPRWSRWLQPKSLILAPQISISIM